MTHIATITGITSHRRSATIPSEHKTKHHGHWAGLDKAFTHAQASDPTGMPTRSYADARAIAASDMAPLLGQGATLVLSPCASGWIATCRFGDHLTNHARRGWSLAIFDEGDPSTMHYPAIELRFLRIMVEAEGALDAKGPSHQAMPTSIFSTSFDRAFEQLSEAHKPFSFAQSFEHAAA
jgi:hypothetical protein